MHQNGQNIDNKKTTTLIIIARFRNMKISMEVSNINMNTTEQSHLQQKNEKSSRNKRQDTFSISEQTFS